MLLLQRVCSLILLVFVSFMLISYLSIRSELRVAKFRSTIQSSTPRPICVILVHVLFAIYIYLPKLVSNTIFISDDQCSCIKVTQRVSLVKQEVLTLSLHPSSHLFVVGLHLLNILSSVCCFVDINDCLHFVLLYGCHHDLVDRYGIFVSQMTRDIFHLLQPLSTFMTYHGVCN